MTDLKNFNEARLLAKIDEAHGYAVEYIERARDEAREQVGQAVRALAAVGQPSLRSTLDVISAAAWVGVAEIEVRDEARRLWANLQTGHSNSWQVGEDRGDLPKPIPRGRYRALFLLLPVAEPAKELTPDQREAVETLRARMLNGSGEMFSTGRRIAEEIAATIGVPVEVTPSQADPSLATIRRL